MATKKRKTDYDTFSLLLNERHFGFRSIQNISRRTLNHWRKLDHLVDHREKVVSGKPNYFSTLELVWISIISDLREMQIEHTKIKGVKHGLFAPVKASNGKKYPALEYYLMEVFERNVVIYIVLTNTNTLHIVNDLVYVDMLRAGEIENHTLISLNKQVRDTLHEVYKKPDFSEFTGLSIEEIQILGIIRNKAYKYIHITKKNGEIDCLEGTELIAEESRIVDLLKKGEYQNLEIKQHNGKIVSVHRTIRKKITK